MKRKGFTLIELLVVIAIVALLMSILMPALNKARELAQRLVCGANLAGIGKAMVVYSSSFEDEYPRAGGPGVVWSNTGKLYDFDNADPAVAFQDGMATVTSSLFLLIKFSKVTPKNFYCRGDDGGMPYKISYTKRTWIKDVRAVWDFGDAGAFKRIPPGGFCSYSYHMPYVGSEGLSFSVMDIFNPGSPVCADRSPFLDKNASGAAVGDNSASHRGKGQSVLFKDTSVTFQKEAACGIKEDNIFTYGGSLDDGGGDPVGTPPVDNGDGAPVGEKDAYLVTDKNYL
ncbi:MAG: type II secretion system protein [Planctomycetota bacterium]|jgi:prepilin-type N-terminal cleavage/methylation domain-containing protein